MDFCEVTFDDEDEFESYKEIIETIQHFRGILRVLKRGDHLLAGQISITLNFLLARNDEPGCFCKIRKYGWKSKYAGIKEPRRSYVVIHTRNTIALERILEEAYGAKLSIFINGMDPFKDEDLHPENWVKLTIPYEELIPALISGTKDMLDAVIDVRDEYEYEDKDIYLEEMEEKRKEALIPKDQTRLEVQRVGS